MNDLSYTYESASALTREKGLNQLVLAHRTEIEAVNAIPCFFWGNLTEPYLTAKCWSTIAKVVRSSFGPIPPALRDPIITAGTRRIRFEGFSSCNGVYVRLDMKPEAIDGEFLASGTTNVDFNEPMLHALNGIQKNERVTLSVGHKDMQVITAKTKVTERKVSLPSRWIKGLTSVQLYLADMDLKFELNRIQAIQLFQSLPKGNTKGDFHLSRKLGKFLFAAIPSPDSVRIGGMHRLRLLEGLLPILDKLFVYEAPDGQTCALVCEFGKMQLLMAFSPDAYRGFSGEGNVLDSLTENLPMEYIVAVNSLLRANETFDTTLLSLENDLDFTTMENLTAQLSSIGLLGYDVMERSHFYRQLPFKTDRILSMNPRLKNAKRLIADNDITILKRTADQTEAQVKGTDVTHKVLIQGDQARCTCKWYTDYQGKRGICKHILAVKMSI